MQIVLLSGGSGKRLWPLSNNIRAKQFISLLKNDLGQQETMVQRVFRQIKKVAPQVPITIATAKNQVPVIEHQLGEKVNLSIEPCRRDTFPATVLAAAYLRDVQKADLDEVVVVCPVDPYVEDGYFSVLQDLADEAARGQANLVLMGIEPTYPSEKYGYILPKTMDNVSFVAKFKEKPDLQTATEYLQQGALWNCGVFAFKLKYLLNCARQKLGYASYLELLKHYADLPKTSFDYAVLERERQIQVIRYAGEWQDLGTWSTLTQAMDKTSTGNVLLDATCDNVHVVNDLDVPVLGLGLKDLVVAASPEGILVADKQQSSYIKPFVNKITKKEGSKRSWGSFRVLDISEGGLTTKITLRSGHHLHYHSHDYRDELWTVLEGTGWTVVDDVVRSIHPGDVIKSPAGSRHTLVAASRLQVIEIQSGEDILVTDKYKYEYDFEQFKQKD